MGQPKHILVVDDDGDVRDVLVEILQNDNYRVSSVANGALMRDFLETDDAVDCVVLDALMPGESSISLAHHLKEVGTPLVMISGSHDAMEYAEKNGLQLLRKPFHTQELYSALNTALASGEFGHERRVIILSCADLCIYRITMCRRGLNWSCDGHGLVDRARARDVDRARARDEVESYFGGPHS